MRTNGNKVELIDGEPEIIITTFDNLGRQYIALTKPGWYICQNCGKLVKGSIGPGRPAKYCKVCAEVIKKIQDKKTENYT